MMPGRRGRTLIRLTIGLLLLASSLAGVTGLLATRNADPAVSSEWPRPFDPAKPFNMLGVPGVSVEQRKRAEDLLVRSLAEAPRWEDYDALLDSGWYVIKTPATNGVEHLINPAASYDEHMLDPLYPEALLFKVKGEERIFVAYMYMANPGTPIDDPALLDFAGPLIEWHNHSDVCFRGEEGELADTVTGFAGPDGSCPDDGGAGPRIDSQSAMTHVWVTERRCGPFSALEGPLRGVATKPLDERTDSCEH